MTVSSLYPDFQAVLSQHTKTIEQLLEELLSQSLCPDEINRPEALCGAMRYGVFNGGKRLRPFLIIETTSLFQEINKTVFYVAAAVESIHCYSLIHDDLPALDNDDMRRGKPSVHKIFGEATAILAGNALLTLAFDIVSRENNGLSSPVARQLITSLARAIGLGGMIGGQMLDLSTEKEQIPETEILMLQAMKTGALLRFSCEAGAILADRPPEDRRRLRRFGEILGAAFQLADDVLDITAESSVLGKTKGKDIARGKATLVARYGIPWAHQQLQDLIIQANDLLKPYGEKANILRQAASFIIERTY